MRPTSVFSICERIADADGGAPPALSTAVRLGRLTRPHAEVLLEDLLRHLLEQWIVFADVGGGNLVCQQRDDGLRLVIIDGLGARHPGMKLWLHARWPWLARAKTRKQWPQLITNIWRHPG